MLYILYLKKPYFQIKSNPAIVGDLRCVFIKLAGAMEG